MGRDTGIVFTRHLISRCLGNTRRLYMLLVLLGFWVYGILILIMRGVFGEACCCYADFEISRDLDVFWEYV